MGEIVVITGASGFIGFHLIKCLISRDPKVAEIRCLDLVEPEDLKKKLINEEQESARELYGRKKRLVQVRGDIRDINVVEKILEGSDCVIHCAARVDLFRNESNDEELRTTNIEGTENLLRACVRLGVSKFIYVSSFETFSTLDTVYYATEATLPSSGRLLFGASGQTKKDAESKVREYSNRKLEKSSKNGHDSLNAICIRFTPTYGEFDRSYVGAILRVTKLLGGKLRRMSNIWIRQQPIYAANAAWALVVAKQQMDNDQTISGEEFHINDDTPIGDPFDFVQPFLQEKGMMVTKQSYPFLPIWALLSVLFLLMRLVRSLDFLGLFTRRPSRLDHQLQHDSGSLSDDSPRSNPNESLKSTRWFDYITPDTIAFMCTSCFLNRTKASLRLGYEPIVSPDEARKRSAEWYKNHLRL